MRRFLAVAIAAAATLGVSLGSAFQSTPAPDRVEEDWVMVIGTADQATNCPQTSAVMSPTGNDADPSLVFKLNYRDQPSYQAGGLSAQIWQGTSFVSNSDQSTVSCNTNNETVTWTQRMSLSGGSLNFKVLAGNSTTWGQFGTGDADLAVTTSSSLADLSAYKPDYGVGKSGVTYGANRVTSMQIVQVRYYQGSTLLSTDSTPHAVNVAP
jgi:hypothetical protein